VIWLPIEKVLPAFSAPPLVCSIFIEAEPATLNSPAYADVTASEPANADKPIFFKFVHN